VTPDEKAELVRKATEQAKAEGPRAILERYDELFTDDFRWRPSLQASVEGQTEYQGRAGFARYWDDFEAGFSGFSFRDASFRAVGDDTVLVRLMVSVRGTESGIPLEHAIGWVLRFEGDRIAQGEAFLSWAEAEAAAHA